MGDSLVEAVMPAELATGHVILKQGPFVVIEVHGSAGLTVFRTFDESRFDPHDAVCGTLRDVGAQQIYSERSTHAIHGFIALVDGDLRTVLRYLSDHQQRPAHPEPVPLLDVSRLVDLQRTILDAGRVELLDQLERGIWWTYDADPRNSEGLQRLRESILLKRSQLEAATKVV